MNKGIKKNLFLFFILITNIFLPLSFFKVIGEDNIKLSKEDIIWDRVDFDNNLLDRKINWQKYKENESLLIESKSEDSRDFYEGGESNNKIDIFKENRDSYENQIYYEPSISSNYFLDEGDISFSVFWKSSFDGGASGGTGQQNNSFRIDYGILKDLQFSFHFSEADDNLFNLIDGKTIPYFWQNYSVSLKKKLIENENSDFFISLVSSIEYWRSSSGSKFSKSIYNKQDNTFGKEKFNNIVGSISIPISKRINKKTEIYFSPGITFLPEKIGRKTIGKNSYGNNFYLGIGTVYKLMDNVKIYSSYIYPFGPGDNYFDKNLNFSNKEIYTFGINWDVNPMIGVEAKISNSYGSTPSTGLLTIPSDNLPLYYAGLIYKPKHKDTDLEILTNRERVISFGGLTVSNALIPEFDISQVSIDYDSKGSLLGSYKYSLSNIFQIELLHIGSNKDSNHNLQSTNLQKTFFNDNNFNYRIGGKLLLLSPQKDDKFWMSTKISLGRNRQNNQGYIFSEWINTFKINNSLSINVNPKHIYSGIGSLEAIGVSSYINLSDKILFIPEFNKVFSKKNSNNSTFSLRYSYDPFRSVDLYVTNSLGNQDLSQLIKSDNYKFGIRFNFLY